MKLQIKKIFVIFVLLGFINIPLVTAQETELDPLGAKKPVMYSVFWNTLWGSTWGAAMGLSYHLGSGISLRESLISSATIGGVLGYGLGIYLVVSGLSFDKSFLLELPSPKFKIQPQNGAFLEPEIKPLYTRSERPDPTKWKVPIYAFRF